MSILDSLNNFGVIGDTLSNILGNSATSRNSDMIPTATLHMGQKLFSTSEAQLNLPKPKTLYFVYFGLNPKLEQFINYKKKILNSLNQLPSDCQALQANYMDTILEAISYKTLSYEISKMVKGYDKPTINMKTKSYNEYNRKRIIYDSIDYNEVTITFFDVKENPVQEFFLNYIKMINNDFFAKDYQQWEKGINNTQYNDNTNYNENINPFGLTLDSNFHLIDKISFCEYYQNRVMVYTIENPKITKITFGDGKMGDFTSNDIKVTFEYEGLTNDLLGTNPYNVVLSPDASNAYYKAMINHKLTDGGAFVSNGQLKNAGKTMATFLQKKYKSLNQSIATDLVDIIKSYINGDKKFTWNNIQNQILDTSRKYGFANEVNTLVSGVNTVNTFANKSGSERWKFAGNVATDPTTIVGVTSKVLSSEVVSSSTSELF